MSNQGSEYLDKVLALVDALSTEEYERLHDLGIKSKENFESFFDTKFELEYLKSRVFLNVMRPNISVIRKEDARLDLSMLSFTSVTENENYDSSEMESFCLPIAA